MTELPEKDLKVVVVGDGMVGKTCLLITYTTNKFPNHYLPTIFETHYQSVQLESGQIINFALHDTAGQEGYEHLRTLCYSGTDIIIMCFSLTQPESFQNIRYVWFPEVRTFVPDAKIIIVGTKKDLKMDYQFCQDLRRSNTVPVTTEQGISLSKELGAYQYIGKYYLSLLFRMIEFNYSVNPFNFEI